MAAIPYLLTKDEINEWLSFFMYGDPNTTEIQLAILISSVQNALGGKSKADDFIFSNKTKPKAVKESKDSTLSIGKYNPIDKNDLEPFLRPM